MTVMHPIRFAGRFVKRPENISACAAFLVDASLPLSFGARASYLGRALRATWGINCPHTEAEILSFVREILNLRVPGVVVEAGCFKGGSTAKFSLAAQLVGRQLVVFDSFEGIPAHIEPSGKNIYGRPASFPPGSWAGSRAEVERNIRRYGAIHTCRFVKGWFEESMPSFDEPVAAAYLDVDLASSTKTCVRYLWPLLAVGGVLYSQDGHLPPVIEALSDKDFWRRELGIAIPPIEGLGHRKLLRVVKRG